jgi:hypothetical protein
VKQPQTWKDYLKPLHKKDSYGHKWEVVKTSGGRKFFIRRSDSTAEVHKEPQITYYKCKRCKIKATDMGNGIIPDSMADRELTCDELIIKDIIQ